MSETQQFELEARRDAVADLTRIRLSSIRIFIITGLVLLAGAVIAGLLLQGH